MTNQANELILLRRDYNAGSRSKLVEVIRTTREQFARNLTSDTLSEGIIAVLVEAEKLYSFDHYWRGTSIPMQPTRIAELSMAVQWVAALKRKIADCPAGRPNELTAFMDETEATLLTLQRAITPAHTRASPLATRYSALLFDAACVQENGDAGGLALCDEIQALEQGLIFQQQPLGLFIETLTARLASEKRLMPIIMMGLQAELIELELTFTLTEGDTP